MPTVLVELAQPLHHRQTISMSVCSRRQHLTLHTPSQPANRPCLPEHSHPAASCILAADKRCKVQGTASLVPLRPYDFSFHCHPLGCCQTLLHNLTAFAAARQSLALQAAWASLQSLAIV